MILVDTSAWVEFFRADSGFDLEAEVDLGEVVTCLPVIQEVLHGFDDQRAYRVARESMFSLPVVESPMEAGVFEAAVQLYRSARRAGVTVRSGVDCLIAACALRNSLTVLHCDRDFDHLARVAPLEVRSVG